MIYICMSVCQYVGMSVCRFVYKNTYAKMHGQNSVAQIRACLKSVLGGKNTYYSFQLYARAALASMDKKEAEKRSLRNEKT